MDHKRRLADRLSGLLPIGNRFLTKRRLKASAVFSLLLSLGFFAGFLLVSVAFAADDALVGPQTLGLPFESRGTAAGSAQTVASIVREIVKYVGILAVIALTYGGFLFMTSFGDEEKVKKAKGIVKFSLIGVILSITAYSIIDIVNELRV